MGMDEVWMEYEDLKDSVPTLIKKVSELESMNASLSAKCQMLQQEISSLKMQNTAQSSNSIIRWEYKTIETRKLNEKELNDLGKQGWETTGNNLPNGGWPEIIFKRPKKEN